MHACLFSFSFFFFHKILNFWKLYPKRSSYVSQAPSVNLTLKKKLHFISNILANPTLVVKKKRTKTKQNGEWWDVHFGYRGQHLPHKASLACHHGLTWTIFVLVVIPLFQQGKGVCKQKMDSRCVDFEFWKEGVETI